MGHLLCCIQHFETLHRTKPNAGLAQLCAITCEHHFYSLLCLEGRGSTHFRSVIFPTHIQSEASKLDTYNGLASDLEAVLENSKVHYSINPGELDS